MREDLKFCKDCTHFEEGYRFDFCTNPNLPPSLVSGNRIVAVVFCRGNLGPCGKEGQLFEKKEITATSLPWWKKVLKFIKGVKE